MNFPEGVVESTWGSRTVLDDLLTGYAYDIDDQLVVEARAAVGGGTGFVYRHPPRRHRLDIGVESVA